MKTELHFISTLIATAEQRVARQTALIASLAGESPARSQAARATLELMRARLETLHRGRAKLAHLEHLVFGVGSSLADDADQNSRSSA